MENSIHSNTLIVKYLGIKDYQITLNEMENFVSNRDINTIDELWILEHNPVFTLGQASKKEHILYKTDIPIVQSNRGGQVTYHGPGQLIFYLMLDLKRLSIGVRNLVSLLEKSTLDLLTDMNITGHLKKDAPGVYVDNAKIASLGLRIRKGSSFHGLSLNVNLDTKPFSQINPCGYKGLKVTTLLDHVKTDIDMRGIAEKLSSIMANRLKYTTISTDLKR